MWLFERQPKIHLSPERGQVRRRVQTLKTMKRFCQSQC